MLLCLAIMLGAGYVLMHGKAYFGTNHLGIGRNSLLNALMIVIGVYGFAALSSARFVFLPDPDPMAPMEQTMLVAAVLMLILGSLFGFIGYEGMRESEQQQVKAAHA